jgi:hypothetical protein
MPGEYQMGRATEHKQPGNDDQHGDSCHWWNHDGENAGKNHQDAKRNGPSN